MATKFITHVTRRKIFDTISLSKVLWEGRLEEPDFLARIYDLDSMPSTDSRYKSAAGDIWQHRVNNPQDWPYTGYSPTAALDCSMGKMSSSCDFSQRRCTRSSDLMKRKLPHSSSRITKHWRGTATSSTRLTGSVAMPSTDGVVGSPFMAQPLNYGFANVSFSPTRRCLKSTWYAFVTALLRIRPRLFRRRRIWSKPLQDHSRPLRRSIRAAGRHPSALPACCRSACAEGGFGS